MREEKITSLYYLSYQRKAGCLPLSPLSELFPCSIHATIHTTIHAPLFSSLIPNGKNREERKGSLPVSFVSLSILVSLSSSGGK